MPRDHDAVELERELGGVHGFVEVPFLDRRAHHVGREVQEVALERHEAVARRTGLVVQLGRGRHEHAAARQAAAFGPVQPALEERPDAGLAAGGRQRRPEDDVDEALRGELRGSGIRVATVLPGYVETPMTEHNPYPMPFMLPSDEAARRIAPVLDAGKRHGVGKDARSHGL